MKTFSYIPIDQGLKESRVDGMDNISKQRNICKCKWLISLVSKECLGVTKTMTTQ